MVSTTPPLATSEEGEKYISWPIWSCEAKPSPGAVFQESKWWESRPGVDEERCYITQGRATLYLNSGDKGESSEPAKVISIGTGDWVTFKAGFQCRWEVEEAITKHYSYFNRDGSAWNPLDHSESADTSNMSKKQLKRLRRQEVWEQQKALKREKQRTKRQEKAAEKRLLKEQQEGSEEDSSDKKKARTDGNGNGDGSNQTNDNKETRVERKKKIQDQFLHNCSQNFSIIVDCAWESYHSDRALASLGQQLLFCYGENRKASHPSTMYYTGVGPKLNEKLKKTHCDNWVGVHVVPEREYMDMEEYFYRHEEKEDHQGMKGSDGIAESKIKEGGDMKIFTSSENDGTNGDKGAYDAKSIQKKQLVYLTSDATETLTELDSNHAYIIGGIVDRNKYKKATYNKALSQEVKTYSLPIRENIQMGMTHVLTVNHVVQLLLEKGCKGSAGEKTWKEALEKIIPNRKVANTEDAE